MNTTARTRCPNCHTVFEVPMELLTSSDTRARCGECLRIFDALAHLHGSADSLIDIMPGTALPPRNQGPSDEGSLERLLDDSDVDALADDEDDLSEFDADMDDSADMSSATSNTRAGDDDDDITVLDVTYADFDLFSDNAELPEFAYLDVDDDTLYDRHSGLVDTRMSPAGAHDDESAPRYGDQDLADPRYSQSEASVVGELHDVDYVTDQGPREPLVFEYHDEVAPTVASEAGDAHRKDDRPSPEIIDIDVFPEHTPKEKTNKGLRWQHWTLLLFTSTLLISAVALSRSDVRGFLNNHPLSRPVALAVCEVFPCEVPPRVNLDAIKAVSRDVTSHPSAENALIVSVVLRNDASFAQPFPELIVRFTNRTGRLVASRRFSPNEYLQAWRSSDKMSIRQVVPIRLDVTDPGKDASSFELDFGVYRPNPTDSD